MYIIVVANNTLPRAPALYQKSKGPELIWPNIALGVYVVFEEELALTNIQHTINGN